MAEVDGSDGNQYTIPDFALEDTQEKILGILKRQYKLGDEEIKNAQKALRNDDKNSKAQIDALNKLGVDIKSAVDGKGSFLGGLSDAAVGTVGVLGGLGKAVVGVTGGLIALGVSAASIALDLTKGFGDALTPLAQSGAAFGELGRDLQTLIPNLMSFGLSLSDSVNTVERFREEFTVLGSTTTRNLIGEFMRLTEYGTKYGLTQAGAIELLEEEIANRRRLGFLQQRDAFLEAQSMKSMVDAYIEASKVLGKSADDISRQVAGLFDNEDARRAAQRLGPDLTEIITKQLVDLSGRGTPDNVMEGLRRGLQDDLMYMSEEYNSTRASFVSLAQAVGDPQLARDINSSIERARESFRLYQTDPSPENLKAAEKNVTDMKNLTVNLLGQAHLLRDEQRIALGMQQYANGEMQSILANTTQLNYGMRDLNNELTEEEQKLAQSIKDAAAFDASMNVIMGAFQTLKTSVQAGLSPALTSFTDALTKSVDGDKSPLEQFTARLGAISNRIISRLNFMFGLGKDDKENANALSGFLETLAEGVKWAADKFLELPEKLMRDDGRSFWDKFSDWFMDIFKDIAKFVGRQVRKVDWRDLLLGKTQEELIEDARRDLGIARRDTTGLDDDNPEEVSRAMMRAIDPLLKKAQQREYETDLILAMLKESGLDFNTLTADDIMKIFPDPVELKNAIAKVYGEEDMNKAREVWEQTAGKISQSASEMLETAKQDERIKVTTPGPVGEDPNFDTFENVELPLEVKREIERLQKIEKDWNRPMTTADQDAWTKKFPEPADEELGKDPETARAKNDPLLNALTKEPGTPPMASSSNSVMTSTPTDETTAETPTSTDGTKTQSVKTEPVGGTDSNIKLSDELYNALMQVTGSLSNIERNTKNTATGVEAIPGAIN